MIKKISVQKTAGLEDVKSLFDKQKAKLSEAVAQLERQWFEMDQLLKKTPAHPFVDSHKQVIKDIQSLQEYLENGAKIIAEMIESDK